MQPLTIWDQKVDYLDNRNKEKHVGNCEIKTLYPYSVTLHQMLEGSRHNLIIEWQSIGQYTKNNVPVHSALLKFTLYVHGVETPNMQLCCKGILLYYLNHWAFSWNCFLLFCFIATVIHNTTNTQIESCPSNKKEIRSYYFNFLLSGSRRRSAPEVLQAHLCPAAGQGGSGPDAAQAPLQAVQWPQHPRGAPGGPYAT